MFRVPTYVAPSPIAGVGVFASTFIPAGEVLWTFTDGVDVRLSADVLAATPEPLGSLVRMYCFETDDGEFVLCGDNARFMNHSFEPNCDDRGTVTSAKRDIQPGEELTCDYRDFDAESRRTGLASWRNGTHPPASPPESASESMSRSLSDSARATARPKSVTR